MTPTTRRLTADDAEIARRLGWEAFGFPATPSTEPAQVDQPGMTWFGAFDGDALVARMIDRAYDSCFGGALVPTSGIAGVTVAAESRGRGALTPLFAATHRHALERGAAISTLFPTAPGIYRRFGYELIADFVTVQLPTVDLAAVAPATSTTTRRATSADREAVRGVYDRWAIAQNGPLSRRGVSFDPADEGWPGDWIGVTVAEQDGEVTGYAAWNRTSTGTPSSAVASCTSATTSRRAPNMWCSARS